jgi:Putative Ig domain/Right handed beta helix region
MVISAVAVPAVLTAGSGAAAAAPACSLPAPVGGVITLTGSCDTTTSLIVPNGDTLNGAGFTITASGAFSGGVVINGSVTGGTAMNVENLTIAGPAGGFVESNCPAVLTGIFFVNGGGSVSNVHVENMYIAPPLQGYQAGLGIRANARNGVAQTVTITNSVVSNYLKSGLVASGTMTMTVSGTTVGPPIALPPGTNAQNGVQYGGVGPNVGAGGSITASTLYGSGFGSASDVATAVLLYGAKNVTLSNNTITGTRTDIGIAVSIDTFDTPNVPSTGVLISHNHISRTSADVPDTVGVGVDVDSAAKVRPAALTTTAATSADPSATLVCNTFSGWKTNIVGATQGPCITTTTLPDGFATVPYSARLTATGGTAPYTWSRVSGSIPPGLTLAANGVIKGTPTTQGVYDLTVKVTDAAGHSATQPLTIVIGKPPPVPPGAQGYLLTAGDGGVFTFGHATFRGSAAKVHLVAPVVGIATIPDGNGYWLAARDGGVFSYNVPFHGSLGSVHPTAPIVGIAATPDGAGYYLVGADGGVFTFGDAHFKGSLGAVHLAAPIVGMAVTPDNQGYYLVGSDGGVFTFGDAHFKGSLGGAPPTSPIAGIAVDNATLGYWLVEANGALFSFAAPSFGSAANVALGAPVVGITAVHNGLGYRFVASDGGVFCYGQAAFLGSMGHTPLNSPAVGMTTVG